MGFQRVTLWSFEKRGFSRGKEIEIPVPLNLLSFGSFSFQIKENEQLCDTAFNLSRQVDIKLYVHFPTEYLGS